MDDETIRGLIEQQQQPQQSTMPTNPLVLLEMLSRRLRAPRVSEQPASVYQQVAVRG